MNARKLLDTARDLRSQGDNPEYDRGMIELIANLIGLGSESGYDAVATAIGAESYFDTNDLGVSNG